MTNERRQELEERALIVAQEWQQAGLVQSGKYLVPNIADLLQSIEREVWKRVINEVKSHDLGDGDYLLDWCRQQAEVGE